MKALVKYCILLSAFLCLSGCQSLEEREIRKMTGRKLAMPESVCAFDSVGEKLLDPQIEPVKIVTYMDYNNCTDCMVKPLLALETVLSVDSLAYSNVCIIAFVDSIDYDEAKESLGKFRLKSNISIDASGVFKAANKIGELSVRNRTFILDRNNKVVFTGNPALNGALQKSFMYVLSNLVLNDGDFTLD